MKQLLMTRRFSPLFWTQFFGAFNDNVFRNALILFVAYSSVAIDPSKASLVNTIAGGLYILPFFLFSSVAGQITDKFDKAHIIRLVKFIEILIMVMTAVAFYYQHFPSLLLLLFLMGTQSAFFGPAKYSILTNHLEKSELMAGNACIESGTFFAILFGSILGSAVMVADKTMILVGASLILVALGAWICSLFIPNAPAGDPKLKISFNLFRGTVGIIQKTKEIPLVYWTIIGISWFWVIGCSFITQLPVLMREYLHATEGCVVLVFLLFSIGLGIGSFLCHKFFKEKVTLEYMPYLGALISLFMIDFYISAASLPSQPTQSLSTVLQFIQSPYNWRLMIDIIAISIFSGLFVVPLYTVMQIISPSENCSRIIAANNVLNAGFMVASSVVISLFLAGNGNTLDIILGLGLLNIPVVTMVYHRIKPWHQAVSLFCSN